MSFILEALKKSEEERRLGAGPDLNALHAAENHLNSSRRVWPFLFLAVVLLNAFCLLWWLRPWQPAVEKINTPGKIRAERPTSPEKPPAVIVAQDRLPAALPEKSVQPFHQASPGWNDLPAPLTPPRALPSRAIRRGGPARIPYLQELPASVRRQIPELAITLHYYTAAPASRMARINGRVLRQGETLDNQLILEEIAIDAIVFRFGETLFRMGEF